MFPYISRISHHCSRFAMPMYRKELKCLCILGMSLVCAGYAITHFLNIVSGYVDNSRFLGNLQKVKMAKVVKPYKATLEIYDESDFKKSQLYVKVKPTQWPIIYSTEYNIGFLGLEKLHPFDSGKWGRIFDYLKEDGMVRDDTIVSPVEATEEDLAIVHHKAYIKSLTHSTNVASITEIWPVALLPNYVVQKRVLKPFRFQTGGTVLAGSLALDRGWAINLGGGFHHCSKERGGGFCAYADISLTIKFLLNSERGVNKVMIIDLDAHQGNGHERDFMNNDQVYIMDVYNRNIYPQDGFAKKGIKRKVELDHKTRDEEYLNLVESNMASAFEEFTPDIVVYNAGTDVLVGDPLGNLSITPEGIVLRDEKVFEKAKQHNVPILMLTSGGYLRETARIIANSILNLKKKGLISCEEAENAPKPPVSMTGDGMSRSQSDSYLKRFGKWTGWMSRSTSGDIHDNTAQKAAQSRSDDF